MRPFTLFLFVLLTVAFVGCNQVTKSKKDNTENTEINKDENKPKNKPEDIPENTSDPETPGEDPDTNAADEFEGLNRSTAAYMTAGENQMVDEINLIRSNPAGYVKFVEAYIAQLEKDKAAGTGFGNADEEIATARELISELKNTPQLSFLEPKEGIYNAAKKHGEEGEAKGSLDHQGADGEWPWDRVKREAPECSDGNENLVGGSADVRRSVMMLLVDNGIPGRGHRKTLLNPAWTHAACYHVGQVGGMPHYWIQKFGKCN